MTFKCPNCCAPSQFVRKNGFFLRKSDSQKIPRYMCKKCLRGFSSATFSPSYSQNKRRVNDSIRVLLCRTVSQRGIAKILKINRKTVARKLKFLAKQAEIRQQKYLKGQQYSYVQFDDLETIEHTKLKPVTVTLFVSGERKILGFGVARIKAKGHLAELSLKKYGPRKNEAPFMRERVFSQVKTYIHPLALIQSDKHPSYPDLVKKHFPKAEFSCFRSKRPSVGGQGELKKTGYDPLFKINHTLAMLRANISRLIRRTWNTTKCIECLRDHLMIYMDYHNLVLTCSADLD